MVQCQWQGMPACNLWQVAGGITTNACLQVVRARTVNLSGCNDMLLISDKYHASPEDGAVMGVEMKKELSVEVLACACQQVHAHRLHTNMSALLCPTQDIQQAEMEYILFAQWSIMPFGEWAQNATAAGGAWYLFDATRALAMPAVQLLTDLQRGGVAFYMQGRHQDGTAVIVQRVLPSMQDGALAQQCFALAAWVVCDSLSLVPCSLGLHERVSQLGALPHWCGCRGGPRGAAQRAASTQAPQVHCAAASPCWPAPPGCHD